MLFVLNLHIHFMERTKELLRNNAMLIMILNNRKYICTHTEKLILTKILRAQIECNVYVSKLILRKIKHEVNKIT